MRKRRKTHSINGGFQLPEPIIHRIQFFLTAKEAARTSILSKSWRSAWLTRPNLDLDLNDFGYTKFDEFSELAKTTIQRYEQSNLNIESLRLYIDAGDLANDLITRAFKIGATHLNLQFTQGDVLPQVVFEGENLVQLSVDGCNIDNLGCDLKVRCSKLESLCLRSVEISSVMVSNIASYCPLIGKLSLCNVSSFNNDGHVHCSFLGDLSSKFPSLKDLTLIRCKTQEVSSRSLERLYFEPLNYPRLSVEFDVPSIRKFRFEGDDIPSLSFVSAPREWESDVFISVCLSTSWFRRLNKFLTESSLSRIYLSLDIINDYRFQDDVGDIRGLPKPKVENLTVNMNCLCDLKCFALFHGLFHICRPKFITVDKTRYGGKNRNNGLLCKTLKRGLDDECMYGLHDLEEVNVHHFDEHVVAWQPLPLKSLLDPSIILCDGSLSTSWFRRLNKFLAEPSLSRIYLSFDIINDNRFQDEVGDIRGLPKPKVENLTLNMNCLKCFALFHGLFHICRPKFVTVDKMGFGGKNRRNGLLCKTLAQGLDDKLMYGLNDLEEVNVHLFDKHVDVWRHLPLKSLLDPSVSLKGIQKTRFQLKWKM